MRHSRFPSQDAAAALAVASRAARAEFSGSREGAIDFRFRCRRRRELTRACISPMTRAFDQCGRTEGTLDSRHRDFSFPYLDKHQNMLEFDVDAGRIEIPVRRIGRNELMRSRPASLSLECPDTEMRDKTAARRRLLRRSVSLTAAKKTDCSGANDADPSPLGNWRLRLSRGLRAWRSWPTAVPRIFFPILKASGLTRPGVALTYGRQEQVIGGFCADRLPGRLWQFGGMTSSPSFGTVYSEGWDPDRLRRTRVCGVRSGPHLKGRSAKNR